MSGESSAVSPGPVPAGWREDALANVTSWMSGGTPSKGNPDFWGGTTPWISAKSLKSFYLFDSDDCVTDAAIADGARLAEPGDVLMLVRGMTLHNDVPVGIAMRPMTFNQDVKGIRGRNGVVTRFIAYWLLGHKSRLLAAVDQASHGTGRLRTDLLHGMRIRFPREQDRQRAIVAVLGALDDKIELNRLTALALERLARAIFRAWFVDFEPVKAKAAGATAFPSMPQEVFDALPTRFVDSDIGPVPEGWEVKPATGVATVAIGKTPSRKEPQWFTNDPSQMPWVSIRDMGTCGAFIGTTSEYLTREAVERFRVRRIPDRSVLYSFKLTLGRVTIADGEITSNEAIAHFIPNSPDSIGTEYLYCYLIGFDHNKLGSTSSIATATNSKIVKGLPILVPLSATAEAFTELTRPMFNALRSLTRESNKLAEMRDYLLPRLLSGIVRVEVANG